MIKMVVSNSCSQCKSLKAFSVVLSGGKLTAGFFICLWGNKMISLSASGENRPKTNLASCSCQSTHPFLLTLLKTCITFNHPRVSRLLHISRQTLCRSSRLTWPGSIVLLCQSELQLAQLHLLGESETPCSSPWCYSWEKFRCWWW